MRLITKFQEPYVRTQKVIDYYCQPPFVIKNDLEIVKFFMQGLTQANRAYIGDMVQGKVKRELCNNVSKQYVDKKE